MKKNIVLIMSVFFAVNALNAYQFEKPCFIENRGQWADSVKYLVKLGGVNTWFTDKNIINDYFTIVADDSESIDTTGYITLGHVVNMNLNQNHNTRFEPTNEINTHYSYILGNDKNKWVANIPAYSEIIQKGVYDGIDVRWLIEDGKLRYDFLVAPGADISQIKISFDGQENLSIESDKVLKINVSIGKVSHADVLAFQGNKNIECSFVNKQDGTIGFTVANYDKNKGLIIDPRIYSTYVGGDGAEGDMSSRFPKMGINSKNEIILTGRTGSENIPTSTGAYRRTKKGSYDIVIAKFSSKGDELLYCTYFGGFETGWENPLDILIDSDDNIIIAGETSSSNSTFPVTDNAFDKRDDTNYDAFLSKFNPDATTLLASTLFGGMLYDKATNIAIDSLGFTYILGTTTSNTLPKTQGGYQEKRSGGGEDGFIAKFNSDYSDLIQCTYIGGGISPISSQSDFLSCISVNSNGEIFISGYTASTDYPVTKDAYQKKLSGSFAGIFSIFNSALTELKYSTYVGGSDIDNILGHVIKNENEVILYGYSSSENYPISSNALKSSIKTGDCDIVITDFDYKKNKIIASTFLGGDEVDICYEEGLLKIDRNGDIFIAGYTLSENYPVTADAYQKKLNTSGMGIQDCCISKLSADLSTVKYSSYFGGEQYERATDLILIDEQYFCFSGITSSAKYPTSEDAYQGELFGSTDFFFTMMLDDCYKPKLSFTPSAELYPVGSPTEITLSDLFYNNKPEPVTITNVYFSGANSTALELVAPQMPKILQVDEKADLIVNFTPDSEIQHSIQIVVETECSKDSITFIADTYCPELAEFNLIDTVYATENTTKPIKISDFFHTNATGIPVKIIDLYFRTQDGSKNFKAIAPALPILITPDGVFDFEFTFNPDALGVFDAELIIVTPCSEYVVPVSGVGEYYVPPRINISADSLSANSGKYVIMPIKVEIFDEITRATTLTVDVTFNASILYPFDYRTSSVTNGQRIVSLSDIALPRNFTGTFNADTLRFLSMLGEVEETPIIFKNAKTDIPSELSVTNGHFKLTDICREGGTRLFVKKDVKNGLKKITPNPASNKIQIDYTLIENAKVKIEVFNSIGELINIVYDEETVSGEHYIVINTGAYSSGVYYVRMTTRTGLGFDLNSYDEGFIINK